MNKFLFYNLRPSLWKNGQGKTYQLEIHPANSSIEKLDFFYRISFAEITGPNQFSQYPNYSRILTVIKGTGLKINQSQLLKNEILNFNGEDLIHSDILNSEHVLDFGIIYDEKKVEVDFQQLREKQFYTTIHDISFFLPQNFNSLEKLNIIKIENKNEPCLLNDKFDYFLLGINFRR